MIISVHNLYKKVDNTRTGGDEVAGAPVAELVEDAVAVRLCGGGGVAWEKERTSVGEGTNERERGMVGSCLVSLCYIILYDTRTRTHARARANTHTHTHNS